MGYHVNSVVSSPLDVTIPLSIVIGSSHDPPTMHRSSSLSIDKNTCCLLFVFTNLNKDEGVMDPLIVNLAQSRSSWEESLKESSSESG